METGLNFLLGTNQVVQIPVALPAPLGCADVGHGGSPAAGFCQIGPLYSV